MSKQEKLANGVTRGKRRITQADATSIVYQNYWEVLSDVQ